MKSIISVLLAFGVSAEYELLSRLKDARIGYFNPDQMKNTGNENVGNPDANTYSVIGTASVKRDDYMDSEGNFQFKLVWDRVDGGQDVLIWKQSSFVNDDVITGYQEISAIAEAQKGTAECGLFKGLGRSNNADSSYIDGNGPEGCWYNSVGTFVAHNGGIPGFAAQTSYSYTLYIYEPTPDCEITDICDAVALIDDAESRVDTVSGDLLAVDNALNARIDSLVTSLQSIDAAHAFMGQSLLDTSPASRQSIVFSVADLLLFAMNMITIVIGLCICWRGGVLGRNSKVMQYAKVGRRSQSESEY